MQVIYYGQEMPEKFSKSMFLAGPSLREDQKNLESWRKNALQILHDKDYDGVVFVPEYENEDSSKLDYKDMIEWEEKYLNIADCIVFWVPRNVETLPGFTTNIEWGAWCDSGKVVFGAPEDAEKVKYLKYYADKYNVPMGDTLTETLDDAISILKEGAEREGGERCVPLFVWKTDSFQSWYKAQKNAGNRLESANLLYSFRPRFKSFIFLWILKVAIYVSSEDRIKDNEIVIARTDISSVVMWKKREPIETTQIVLIKEFRSPAATEDGFIRELPSGSFLKPGMDPIETAAEEIHEETGMMPEVSRLKLVSTRQLCGTFSAHKCSTFSYELSDEEVTWLISQEGIPHGNIEDTERTFIEVSTLSDILTTRKVDWSVLGQISSVIFGIKNEN